MPETIGVRFQVEYPSILPGQRIGVCGSSKELGSWDPLRCLELVMSDEHSSLWVAPHAVEVDLSTKYKFVVILPSGEVRWQDGSDRVLPPEAHSHGRARLSSDFNSWQQSVMPDNSPLAKAPEATAASAEELAQPDVNVSQGRLVEGIRSLDFKTVVHYDEPEGERSPSPHRQSSAGLQAKREVVEVPPRVPLLDAHVAEGASARCASEVLASAPPRKGAASVGDEAEETPSTAGVQKAEAHEPSPAADMSPNSEDDGLVQSLGVWLTEDHVALCASADAMIQRIRQRSASLGYFVGGAPSRTARLTAAAAAAGGVAMGTSGAVTGLAVGSFAGAACGLLPAVITFGLSVPIGAALGGGAGLGLGMTLGTTAGAAGGGMAGYGLAKRTTGKVEP